MTILTTERLLLRNFRNSDWEALQRMILQYQSSAYALYDYHWPTAEAEIKKITEWLVSGDNYLAVCLKDSGQLIGLVSLNDEEGRSQARNLGYIFNFDYHGQGFATEACRAIIQHAFEQLPVQTIIAGTAEANRPSRRLLEKLGFKKTAENTASLNTTPDGHPFEFLGYTYELSKAEWGGGKR